MNEDQAELLRSTRIAPGTREKSSFHGSTFALASSAFIEVIIKLAERLLVHSNCQSFLALVVGRQKLLSHSLLVVMHRQNRPLIANHVQPHDLNVPGSPPSFLRIEILAQGGEPGARLPKPKPLTPKPKPKPWVWVVLLLSRI